MAPVSFWRLHTERPTPRRNLLGIGKRKPRFWATNSQALNTSVGVELKGPWPTSAFFVCVWLSYCFCRPQLTLKVSKWLKFAVFVSLSLFYSLHCLCVFFKTHNRVVVSAHPAQQYNRGKRTRRPIWGQEKLNRHVQWWTRPSRIQELRSLAWRPSQRPIRVGNETRTPL